MTRHFTRVFLLLALLAVMTVTACFVRTAPGRGRRGVYHGPQKHGKWKKPKKHRELDTPEQLEQPAPLAPAQNP